MAAFIIAWGLLTAIKWPFGSAVQDVAAGQAFSWFPTVGAILGGGLALIWWGGGQFLPPLPLAAMVLLAWLAFSGLLHIDGLMDCCDALLPPLSSERRLVVLKDVHAGAFGVAGVTALLICKVSLIASLTGDLSWRILWLAPVLGRWAMVWVAVRYPSAREEGMGHYFRRGLGQPQLFWASLTALVLSLGLLSWMGVWLLLAAWLATLGLVHWTLRRLPGLTGDVYGAICELVEVVVLLTGVLLYT